MEPGSVGTIAILGEGRRKNKVRVYGAAASQYACCFPQSTHSRTRAARGWAPWVGVLDESWGGEHGPLLDLTVGEWYS